MLWADAALRAAFAWASLALTSGESMKAMVSPLWTFCPSFTNISSILPGTFPETRYSLASASPWMTSGFGFETK